MNHFHKLRYLNILGVFLLIVLLTACLSSDKAHFTNFRTFDSTDFIVTIKLLDDYTGESPPTSEHSDRILIEQVEDSGRPLMDTEFIGFKLEGTDIQGFAQMGVETPIDRSTISTEQVQSWQDDNKILTLILDIGKEPEEVIELVFRGNSIDNYKSK